MGIQPWSPLAYGLLAGSYDRQAIEAAAPRTGGLPREAAEERAGRPEGDKRLDGANPFGDSLFTERNWLIVEAVRQVAREAGETPARVALAWVIGRAGVASTLIGVSRLGQLMDNIAALEVSLSPAHRSALDAASHSEPRLIYSLSKPPMRSQVVFGGASVAGWAA
jgi:aryl-alcohol dehydrogenase-like predicted oxidoreductase